jgi:hypothetical protein
MVCHIGVEGVPVTDHRPERRYHGLIISRILDMAILSRGKDHVSASSSARSRNRFRNGWHQPRLDPDDTHPFRNQWDRGCEHQGGTCKQTCQAIEPRSTSGSPPGKLRYTRFVRLGFQDVSPGSGLIHSRHPVVAADLNRIACCNRRTERPIASGSARPGQRHRTGMNKMRLRRPNSYRTQQWPLFDPHAVPLVPIFHDKSNGSPEFAWPVTNCL